ncbi:MAG: PHP domain-containing protein [Candidatus Omnitrophica bacterium]|nr:PHP domain-containing protein [Candidatus Omnitrophota bacterium]
MKYADLHLHTVFSDGTYTPEELIEEVCRQSISAVSVVDHDNVDGIEPVKIIAEQRNIEVLPGIELTAEYNGTEVHILGYLIEYKDDNLTRTLDTLKRNRNERIYKILDRLRRYTGIDLEASLVFDIAKGGTVGRLHIARALVKNGIVNSISEAFQRYIGDKCPAYVAGFRFSPQQAIGLIKQIGGIPVLAHPYSLDQDELIPELVNNGLRGLEVFYPEHTQAMVNHYLDIAKKFNLLITGGSDCHGSAKPEVRIGSIKIPYTLVNKLKKEKAQNG